MMNKIINLLYEYNTKELEFDSDYTYEGRVVPRVTRILSKCIHSDSLMYWANSLGFRHQSYTKTLNKACDIGSECHYNIDKFIDDPTYTLTDVTMAEVYCAYNSFLKWYRDINKAASVEVILHEESMACPYFGGTLDGLYKVNGKYYLVDYKTSNHITYKYCLQLAAYKYMLKTQRGIDIDGCIVLQLNKDNVSYNEYVLNFDNQNHLEFINLCEQTFLSLVYAYYNLTAVESAYENLDWKKE